MLEKSISKFDSKKNSYLFFEGEMYDAYSLLIDILNSSKSSIILIDNYIDKSILDVLRNIEKDILIITNKYNNLDYKKYKSQYKNIRFKISNSFHDTFIVIDKEILYHCGALFKDLGKKCFNINKIEEKKIIKDLLDMI